MSSNEIYALLIGASIALLSSLLTTLVTSLFNHWLSRRSQRQDKVAKLHYLIGKMAVRTAKNEEWVEVWREQKKRLDHLISLGNEDDFEGMTGLLEGIDNKIEDLEDLLEVQKQKKDKLESEQAILEAKVVEMAIGKILLLNQRRDIILGFNQDEQNRRALAMKTILSELDKNELITIAMEEKPLPDLPS